MDPKALAHDLTIELYGASRFHAEENVRLKQENDDLKAKLAALSPEEAHDAEQ